MPRPRKASVKLPPHVHAVTARGKPYYYFQRYRGTEREEARIKLPGVPLDRDGTPNPDWWRAYREVCGDGEPIAKTGSFTALIAAYKESPEWHELSNRTRSERERHLAKIGAAWGELSVAGLEARHVLKLRDQYAGTPGEANNIVRSLSSLMSWSIPRGWRAHNPCAKIRMLRIGEGYAPWTWEEIETFRTHARRDLWWAAAVALYSGQRQADVIAMRWSDIQEGLVSVTQSKTGKKLWIPMHENLRAVLAEITRVSVHVLTNSRGVPWTTDGFKTSWGDEMKRAPFKELHERELVFHGLRKSAVVFLLEAGCTDAEVSAITGQSRGMVAHYARQVNQKKLAAAAVLKWQAAGEPGRKKNGNEPGL